MKSLSKSQQTLKKKKEIDKVIPKSFRNAEDLEQPKQLWKKNTVGRVTLHDFKIFYKATIWRQFSNWISTCRKTPPYFDSYFAAYTNINSKWIVDLNVKHKPIKLLRENTGENLCDLELGDDFLYLTHKAWSKKERINKLNSIKIKNICSFKNSFKNGKKSPRLGESIAMHISHKGLVPRKYTYVIYMCVCIYLCLYILVNQIYVICLSLLGLP